MNFTDNPFERMMRQRPGTDSGHPCKHCRHKWECGYLLHQCRKKFRSVLGDTAPPVVTDNNIKSFDRVARKYGIDYSLKKVDQDGKTEYMVFFKAKDVDVMTAAFKEYTSETLKKQKRESVRQKLEKVKEELSNHRQLKKEKKREQEPIR